jgi:hypothetical protein
MRTKKGSAVYHCPFFSFFLSLRQNFVHLRTAADHSSLLLMAFPWLSLERIAPEASRPWLNLAGAEPDPVRFAGLFFV